MGIVEQYLAQLNIEKRRLHCAAAILTVLSLLVAVGVSWNLRMTGITMANSAGCGWKEHQHVEECLTEGILICGYDCEEQHEEETAPPDGEETETVTPEEEPEEHVHTDECWQREYICGYDEHIHDITCYSDPKADVENQLDWQEIFENYPYTGELYKDLVGIAKTQVGYTESALNYETDDEGIKHGYTRYGAWYGSPYSDWSAMFVSFCLEYAGADTDEYPVSPGADTMAGLWDNQGKYIAAGEYTPQIGDIVFFDDNTAGIVAEVQNSTIYVIAGDVDDAVSGQIIPINDNSIEGWGVIERTQPEDEAEVTDEITDETVDEVIPEEMQGEVSEEIIDETVIEEEPDISDGPVVTIYAESIEEPQEEEIEQIQTYSLKNTRADNDFLKHLNGRGGSHEIVLTTKDDEMLPKDENGNFIVQEDTQYKLSIGFDAPNGILPGTYTYQLPSGLDIVEGEGDFIIKEDDGSETKVGTWVISEDGLITMTFYENMRYRTNVAISIQLGVFFDAMDNLIDFDGQITVTIKKPEEEIKSTLLGKWAIPGDSNQIHWHLEIDGNNGSDIPGKTITDVLVNSSNGVHRYTTKDKNNGLTIMATEPDGNTRHTWNVKEGAAGLTWTEDSWSYTMPTSIYCNQCRKTVTLGNDGWSYRVDYTSTMDEVNGDVIYKYGNTAELDGAITSGDIQIAHGNAVIGDPVEKTGTFVADAESGKYIWEIKVSIPGMRAGEKASYNWNFGDYMLVFDREIGKDVHIANDIGSAHVTVNYMGRNFEVPKVDDATEDDFFAWNLDYLATDDEGVGFYGYVNLLCRCQCNENNCQQWNKEHQYYGYIEGCKKFNNEFCHCWTAEAEAVFTFTYETDAAPVIEAFGGLGYQLQNIIDLTFNDDFAFRDSASVPIPGVFKKELTQAFDGYIAHYQITVNEAKLVLTDNSPLTIHDVMTETLVYTNGSLVIRAEDANGNITTLQQGEDYTVTYDGSGNQKDEQGNSVHVLDIEILNPQPVMYILDYDATLVKPKAGTIYNNYATITLWGNEHIEDKIEKVYTAVNISGKNYKVELFKKCGHTNEPLPGASFGLYNSHGGLIAENTTDENGRILFATDISEGIILREHVLYYMQETEAPLGYILDNTKHWFVFCDSKSGTCNTCTDVIGDTGAKRIPLETLGEVSAVNMRSGFELPATGGSGNIFNTLCGLILISAPLVYGLSLRRKYERRLRE